MTSKLDGLSSTKAGALGQSRGMELEVRWEAGSGWGTGRWEGGSEWGTGGGREVQDGGTGGGRRFGRFRRFRGT